jgi:hypothetical protein
MAGGLIVEDFNNDIFSSPAGRNRRLKGCVAAALEVAGRPR